MKKKKPELPTSIRFPTEVKKELKEIAKKEHRTFGGMVVKIVIDFLNGRK